MIPSGFHLQLEDNEYVYAVAASRRGRTFLFKKSSPGLRISAPVEGLEIDRLASIYLQ